jgi:hypothetical protein
MSVNIASESGKSAVKALIINKIRFRIAMAILRHSVLLVASSGFGIL